MLLVEFYDVVRQDLPLVLPPVRLGHEFEIDVQDDAVPVHRPWYELSPMELT